MNSSIYNFSAGPATLPKEVLLTVQDQLLSYKNSGMSVMELSHRGKFFSSIIEETEALLRELLDISKDYAALFLPGGATLQFSMIPMTLLRGGKTADYIISGIWAEKAAEEAKKFGNIHIAGSSAESKFSSLPKNLLFSENPAYVHFTSNNTIVGTQYDKEPNCGGRTLVCDASSDLLHKKIDVSRYGIIYAGAQKNLGPAGVTVVIIRKNLVADSLENTPIMLDYHAHIESNSLYNTPPTFPIYVMGEVFRWIKQQGGLSVIEKRNREKASLLYDALDSSSFYRGHATRESRSLMNVTFRLPSEDLEKLFLKQAEAVGFLELKGHRLVGGLRASIYNAFPRQGIVDLVSFMKDFEQKNG